MAGCKARARHPPAGLRSGLAAPAPLVALGRILAGEVGEPVERGMEVGTAASSGQCPGQIGSASSGPRRSSRIMAARPKEMGSYSGQGRSFKGGSAEVLAAIAGAAPPWPAFSPDGKRGFQ